MSLEVTNLSKQFHRKGVVVHAVQPTSFTIPKGSRISIVGASGAGKTTLMNMLCLWESPTEGRILLDGYDYAQLDEGKRRQVFQKLQIQCQSPLRVMSPTMTIGRFLEGPLRYFGLETDKGRRQERVIGALAEVGLDQAVLQRLPHELSGGQLQRVLLARVLLVNASYVLFDEPTSALDQVTENKVLALIKKKQEEYGFASVFVTHNIDVAMAMSDDMWIMENGAIVERVAVKAGLDSICTDYGRRLVQASLLIKSYEP